MPRGEAVVRFLLDRWLYKEQVQELAAQYGLPTSGTKEELVARSAPPRPLLVRVLVRDPQGDDGRLLSLAGFDRTPVHVRFSDRYAGSLMVVDRATLLVHQPSTVTLPSEYVVDARVPDLCEQIATDASEEWDRLDRSEAKSRRGR